MLSLTTSFRLLTLCFAIVSGLFVSAANAQVQGQKYVYVSALNGVDTNTCTRIAPCREVTRAMSLALSEGTVTILDSGEYQKFNITKSVNIIAAPGVLALIKTGGIYVFTPEPAKILIKNLTIDSSSGLTVSGPLSFFTVEDCVFQTSGTSGTPLQITGSGSYVFRNTKLISNYSPFPNQISPSSGEARVLFENCIFQRNFGALFVSTGGNVTIRNSIAQFNGIVFAVAGSGRLFIENCLIDHNSASGVIVSETGYVGISDSTIINNGDYGITNNGGDVRSFGNNRIYNNTSGNIFGSVVVLALQ